MTREDKIEIKKTIFPNLLMTDVIKYLGYIVKRLETKELLIQEVYNILVDEVSNQMHEEDDFYDAVRRAIDILGDL